jgi:hypothetical protein
MANFLYDSAREKFLSGELSWLNDDIRVAILVNNVYSGNDFSRENHITLSDIPSTAIYKTSTPLTHKEATKGIANAAPVVFRAVPSGVTFTSVVIYKKGSSATSSPLIAHIDIQLQTTGLDDVSIQWNTTDNKIFKL